MKNKILSSRIFFTCLSFVCLAGHQVTAQETSSNSASQKVEIKQIDSQKALVVKVTIPSQEISQKMGEMYQRLFIFLGSKNIQPVGSPFAVYYEYDPSGNTTFEAGVPVATSVKGEGDIVFKEYPAMKVVSTLHVGAYDKVAPAYTAIDKYIKDNKLKFLKPSWEIYLSDPSKVKPEENKTLIYFPVK